MIDEMPNEEFIDFMLLFMDFVEEFSDDELEEWEYDDSEEDEELPF